MSAETKEKTETAAEIIERKLTELMGNAEPEAGKEDAAPEPKSETATEEAPPETESKPTESEGTPEVAEQSAPEAESKDTPEETTEDPELDKALSALVLDGVPTAILESAPRETLLSWGAEAAKRHAKRNKDLADRSRRIEELERGPATTEAEQLPTPTAPVDLKAIAEKLTSAINEGRDVSAEVSELVASIETRMKKADPQRDRVLQQAIAAVDEMGCAQARKELVATLPRLNDPAAYKAVREDMDALAALGKANGKSPTEAYPFLMKMAYYAKFGEADALENRQSAAEIRRKRANGQPTVPSLKDKPTPKSDYEKRVLLTEALMQGKTPEEARKLVYG
jgi:hypothetical protein